MTQAERLKEALTNGHKITRLSALIDLGIFELSARIIDLERQGYKFNKPRIKVTNRFGESVTVVEYSLKKPIKTERQWNG
jgi:hypothetical protein